MIKKLYEEGMGVKAIARKLGHCPKTVRKYLRLEGDKPPKTRRKSPGSQLDPYLPTIAQVLQEDHEIPATVLYEQIKGMGYEGSLRRLQEMIARHDFRQRSKNEEELVRFETKPGKQMQVDWIEFPKEGLSAFVATLGYSRMSYVQYVTDEKLETLIACHMNAFAYFGGVPEEVLYDNMKTVILERNVYGKGKHRFHPTFADFAKHCGFAIRVCRPYRAKTKGKVERFNHYLRYSFHKPLVVKLKMLGVTSMSVELANAEVLRWLEQVANARVHQEMLSCPCDLLKEEREALGALPPAYEGIRPSGITGEATTTPSPAGIPKAKPSVEIPLRDLSLYDRFIPKSGILAVWVLLQEGWTRMAA